MLGLLCLSRSFWQATSVRNFRTTTIQYFYEPVSSIGFKLACAYSEFVCFVALCPSQQLWSLRDGHFT